MPVGETGPTEATAGAGEQRFAGVFRALGSRNFRLFFGGQGLSLIGTWMTRVATSWLVYRLTGSAWWLGVIGFASQIPTFFLAPLAGVLVDRWDRRRLLVATQFLAMLQSLILAALTLGGRVRISHLVLLSVAQGIINAFDMPGRQSFLVRMVDRREDLSNAIALNSSMFNGARLIGPSIAGLVIAAAGEGVCFLVDGLSYIAVVAALLAMRLPDRASGPPPGSALREFREGLSYVTRFTPISHILALLSLVSLVAMPYTVLMPVISRTLLGGGANTFGFLMAATGLGALGGALYMASRRSVLGLGRLIPLATGTFGLGLMVAAWSRNLWLTLALMVVIGLAAMVQLACCNTLLQTIVDEDKRGRVMSFYTMAFMGMTPLGSLIAGALAGRIGTPQTLAISGACCLVGAVWFHRRLPAIRREVRPIYVRMGILPEVARGLQAANAEDPSNR
jgi:MFS family permease